MTSNERCLIHQEYNHRSRHCHSRGQKTLWAEEQGHWSMCLPADEDLDEILEPIETLYVGTQLPQEVYAAHSDPPSWTQAADGCWSVEDDDSCVWWRDYGDGYCYHDDSHGVFWSWSKSREDHSELSPEQQKEVDEAVAVAQNKVKTFLQARRAVKSKQLTRGFYPSTEKGKSGVKIPPRVSLVRVREVCFTSTTQDSQVVSFVVQGARVPHLS